MPQDSSYISIQNVSKHFGSVKAVDNVSIDIAQGEFFSLLGSSGCGKTTLLRMLAGFETPTLGEIIIDGQAMSAVPPHERPVNMVFQSYAIFPHLSIRDNIAYGLRKAKLSKAEVDNKVEEMLEMIKLPGYGSRRSHELSGGERQRVALARALIMRPKVLLLDEPLGALDKQLREQMQLELRELQRSVGITFVFVTHDQEEALTMSDRIAVMSKGRDLQVDTPTVLYETPKTKTVAAFIGNINFFDVKIVSVEGDQVKVDAGPLGVVNAPLGDQSFSVGEQALIAIRPEKFNVFENAPEDTTNCVEGKTIATAYLGERSHYYVNVPGLEKRIAISEQNMAPADESFRDEDWKVWLTWADNSVVLLKQD